MKDLEAFLLKHDINIVAENKSQKGNPKTTQLLANVLMAISQSDSHTASLTFEEPFDPSIEDLSELGRLLKETYQLSFPESGLELYCEAVPWTELGQKSRLDIGLLRAF